MSRNRRVDEPTLDAVDILSEAIYHVYQAGPRHIARLNILLRVLDRLLERPNFEVITEMKNV